MDQKDIQFLLSGGATNTDPTKSLGGEASTTQVSKTANNLFDDVTSQQVSSGTTDYRCIYIKLIATTERLKKASVFLRKDTNVGATVMLGLSLVDDTQVVTVYGSPVGGAFRLKYTETTVNGTKSWETRNIMWMPDADFMAQRIAALINSLGNLTGVTCTGQQTATEYDFIVTFSGTGAGRIQQLLEVSWTKGLTVNVAKLLDGGPINRVAPDIGISNNPPADVTFVNATKNNPVEIGTMLPGDFVAVWVMREVDSSTIAVQPDRFGIKMMGEPAPLNTVHHLKD